MRAPSIILLIGLIASLTGCAADSAGRGATAKDPKADKSLTASEVPGGGEALPAGQVVGAVIGKEIQGAGSGVMAFANAEGARDILTDDTGTPLPLPELSVGGDVRFSVTNVGVFVDGTGGAKGLDSGGEVLARIDVPSGKTVWSVPADGLLRISEERVFILRENDSGGGELNRLDPATGASLWAAKVPNTNGLNDLTAPLIDLGVTGAKPLDAETGKLVADAPPATTGEEAASAGNGIVVEGGAKGVPLRGLQGGRQLWETAGEGEILTAGYQLAVVFNAASLDYVVLDAETGKTVASFSQKSAPSLNRCDRRTVSFSGRGAGFLSEHRLALDCSATAGFPERIVVVAV